jgi:hypothetical protein
VGEESEQVLGRLGAPEPCDLVALHAEELDGSLGANGVAFLELIPTKFSDKSPDDIFERAGDEVGGETTFSENCDDPTSAIVPWRSALPQLKALRQSMVVP